MLHSCVPQLFFSRAVGWNYDGSLLSSVGKNGVVAAFDPRAGAEDVLVSVLLLLLHCAQPCAPCGKQGKAVKLASIGKPQHALWVGREQKFYLGVLGLGSAQRPTVNFFDPREL